MAQPKGTEKGALVTGFERSEKCPDDAKPFIDNVSGSREYPHRSESMAAEVKFSDSERMEPFPEPLQEKQQQPLPPQQLLSSPPPPQPPLSQQPPSQPHQPQPPAPQPPQPQPPAPEPPSPQPPAPQPPPPQPPPSQPPPPQPQPQPSPAQGPASPQNPDRQKEGSVSFHSKRCVNDIVETREYGFKFKGDVPEDAVKDAVRRGSEAVVTWKDSPQTTEGMADVTEDDSSSITASKSNTAPATNKYNTAASDVLPGSNVNSSAPNQPNKKKEPQNKDGDHGHSDRRPDEEGVKNNPPAEDQAASLPSPSHSGEAGPPNSQVMSATTASGKNPPTEHT